MPTRKAAIEILAQKANIANGFPMEDDEKALEIIGSTWAEVLTGIPDRYLDQCFKAACQDAADERAKIIPAMLLRAWKRMVSDGTIALLSRGDTKDCPNGCVGGWIVKHREGREGVVACPIHRG